MSTLGDIIKRRRDELGLTQKDVARRMINSKGKTVSRPYISKLETGEVTKISAEYLVQLAKALEMDPSELMASVSDLAGQANLVTVDTQEKEQSFTEKEDKISQVVSFSNQDELLVTIPATQQVKAKPSTKLNSKPHEDLPTRKVKLYFADQVPKLTNYSSSAVSSEDRVFVIPACWKEEDIIALQEWADWRSWHNLQKEIFPTGFTPSKEADQLLRGEEIEF